MKVLITTTSFLDTHGRHREELAQTGYEIVKAPGPLKEQQLIEILENSEGYDGFLVGEDEFTARVLEKTQPRTKVISRYGVGLDKIDLDVAQRLGIRVLNTPGVNHTTVTEHTFGLLLSLLRNIPEHNTGVHKGQWRRMTGVELIGKTLGIFGFGRVGKEVAKRAMAFGMNVVIYNTSWSQDHAGFLEKINQTFGDVPFWGQPVKAERLQSAEEALNRSDFVTLHMNLTKTNAHFLNSRRIYACKRGVVIINVSRGALVDQYAMADAIRNGHVGGFGADVVDPEPIIPENPLLNLPRVHLTPHVGSRTVESIVRQGLAAVANLRAGLEGA